MRNSSWNFTFDPSRTAGESHPPAKPASFGIGILWIVLILLSCSEPPPVSQPVHGEHIGTINAYVFKPDAQTYITAPRAFALAPEMSPTDALTALGRHLSQQYFSDDAGEPTLRFEVLGVHHVPAPYRAYRLAVINMVDPDVRVLQDFFQGSAGGQTTYYMLTATFLQPHLDPPLVDGLILLYNGGEFPQTDHANFRGIVATESIKPVVMKILQRQHHLGSGRPFGEV